MRCLIGRVLRWADRRREQRDVRLVTAEQFRLMVSNQQYRWARRYGG